MKMDMNSRSFVMKALQAHIICKVMALLFVTFFLGVPFLIAHNFIFKMQIFTMLYLLSLYFKRERRISALRKERTNRS